MNILITGVGGPTPRSIARSIKRCSKFSNCKLYGTDINKYAYGLYEKDLYEQTFIVPKAGAPAYKQAIEDIVQKCEIDFAIIMPEMEVLVWSSWKEKGESLPVKAFLPDHKVAKVLVDKSLMTDILASQGLVPDTVNIDASNVPFDEIENKLGYPFWIRATSGSSGLGSLRVRTQEDLQTWITINTGVQAFMGSTFLPGRNLACKLLYLDGKLIRAASAERVEYIMAKVAPSGITGNTSYGRLLNEPKLVEEAGRAMQIIFEYCGSQPNGFFTVDFKEGADGKPYVTEINVRMVAFNLLFALGGANFSEDIVSILSNDADLNKDYKMYEFEDNLIFLRDVDAEPILMKEEDLLNEVAK